MDIIEENLDLTWEWQGVANNPNLTINFIRKHKDKFNKTFHWVQ